MVAGYVEGLISDSQSGRREKEDIDQLRRSFRPLAIRQIKRWFILQEIQKKEGTHVDEKELDARVTALAKAQDVDPKKLRQQLVRSDQLEKLRRNMEEEKTLNFLVDKAQVEIEPAKSKQ